MQSRRKLFFGTFLLWELLGSQNTSGEALGSQDGPTWGQDGAKMGYDGPTWDQDEAKMGATSQRCVAQRLRVEFRGTKQKEIYIYIYIYIYKLPINRSSGPVLISKTNN